MLIKCSECGKEISDKASTCPNCGCPINIEKEIVNEVKDEGKKSKSNILAGIMLLLGVPLGGLGVWICLFGIIWALVEVADKKIKNKKWAVMACIAFFIIMIMIFADMGKQINEDSQSTNTSSSVSETQESVTDILKDVFKTQNTNKLKNVIIGNNKEEQINTIKDFFKLTSYNLNVISVENITEELLQRFKNKYPNDVNWEQYKIEDMKVYDVQGLSNNEKIWNTFEAYVITVNTDKGEKILTFSNKLLYEDFKMKSEIIPFDTFARNANKYAGRRIGFEGEIVQTLYNENYVEMRINITKNEYGYYSDTIYAFYNLEEGQDKFLDGDIVKAYGTIIGENSYISVLGSGVQLPLIELKSIELVK